MKKNQNNLDKAVKALKNHPISPGPPQQTIDATLSKIHQATEQSPQPTAKQSKAPLNTTVIRNLSRIAAAILLFGAAFFVGRFWPSHQPDTKQLHQALESSLKASLEDSIRQDLLAEMSRHWQLAWAESYVQLRDELARQFRRDLNQSAAEILAASGVVTNQMLTELAQAIDTAQMRNRYWTTAALAQIESNRLQDKSRLQNAFTTFAVNTEDRLRTHQGIMKLLAYDRYEQPFPTKSENSKNNERNKK